MGRSDARYRLPAGAAASAAAVSVAGTERELDASGAGRPAALAAAAVDDALAACVTGNRPRFGLQLQQARSIEGCRGAGGDAAGSEETLHERNTVR